MEKILYNYSDGQSIRIRKEDCQKELALLKVTFGKKFYICRAKTVKPMLDSLGKQIRTGINKRGVGEEALLYHVVRHFLFARPNACDCEVVGLFKSNLELIKGEQEWLDATAENPMCLNNNKQAYVPIGNDFLTEDQKRKFLTWYSKIHPEDASN